MASGQTIDRIHAWADEPPTSSYPTKDLRNFHPVLDFDAASDEATQWSRILPRNYAGGGLTVNIHFSATGITSGNVIFDVSFERIGTGSQDTDSDGYAAVQSVTSAVPATDGNVGVASVAFTNGAQMDSIAVGELYRIKVNRDANNGSDTAAADVELHHIEIKET